MRAVRVLLLWSCLMTGLQAGSLPLTPPPAADGRLQVNVGMIVVDLRAIDDVAQNFEAELTTTLSHAGTLERAHRVDRGARQVFPLMFALVVYNVFG